MKYQLLGHSGIMISELTLGSATFGGTPPVGGVTLEQTRDLVHLALDAGVNSFDTANNYGGGDGETFLGETLRGVRDRVVVTSKVGQKVGDGINERGLSRKHIVEQCNASLKRLKTDYIDLYMFHGPDEHTALDESLGAMEELVRAGKVRTIGCSNFTASQLTELALNAGSLMSCHQLYFSMLNREAEHELLPEATKRGISNVIWSPLAQGILTGKYRRNEPWPESGRHNDGWNEPPIADWEPVFDLVEALVEVAEGVGAAPATVALAWTLQQPGVTSILMGAKRPDQLRRNLEVANFKLPADALETLNRVSAPSLPYPHWHQHSQADRPSIEVR
ncbi:MAG: aldo/keto reductase [Canibacter sp.]